MASGGPCFLEVLFPPPGGGHYNSITLQLCSKIDQLPASWSISEGSGGGCRDSGATEFFQPKNLRRKLCG